MGSEPPSKRRRFFADLDDEVHSSSPLRSSPAVPQRRFFNEPSSDPPSRSPGPERVVNIIPSGDLDDDDDDDLFVPSNPPASELPQTWSPNTNPNSLAFDLNTFESFVGTKVPQDVVQAIRKVCGNNLERAVNMYLDGTYKKVMKPKLAAPAPSIARQLAQRPAVNTAASNQHHDSGRRMPPYRYVGAFGAAGWATRSGTKLLSHGDCVKIERQKTQTPANASSKAKAKLGTPVITRPSGLSRSNRSDVIVRFCTADGTEVGRLEKDTSEWVSTLMDQKVCRFEGTCVYAPERLRTNDTVYIQIRCSLLRSAFYDRGFQLADNRSLGMFEQNESEEEKGLRLRQVALVKLFQEINLIPTRINATAAKHKRKGLLQVAEMDENKQKLAQGTNSGNTSSSSHDEEPEDGQELEQDQLDALYQKAQSFDFNTPEAEPADTFAMTLRPYQKQSLYWMLAKEKDEKDKSREVSMHPLWEEYAWPLKDVDDKDVPQVEGQLHFYVNPYSGDLSLEFPVQQQNCRGGILADEMGLGKTIQMLSLIHTHRSPIALEARQNGVNITSVNDLPRLGGNSTTVLPAPCTTLVIAPMSLLAQWQSEAELASVEGTLRSFVYYGTDKNINLQSLCCEVNAAGAPDVVITSYGVVQSEFKQIASKGGNREGHFGLFSLNFFRVILDEAHTIKNRQSKTAKACYELSAEHRWVLSGTPIVNRLEDLFSLVRFLQVEPWNNFSFWRTFITLPFESKDFMRALDVVQTVLEPLVMRRTKDMKTPDGKPLVALPPKHIEVVSVELSKPERDVYDYIYHRAQQSFNANVEAGTVMKAYTSIFAQILRLRQTCDHPILVRNQDIVQDEEMAAAQVDAATGLADDMDLQALIERFTATTDEGTVANNFGAHILKQIRDESSMECPVCTEEPMEEQTVTGCWHSACKGCLTDYIKRQNDKGELARCFNCREPINMRDLFEVVRHDEHDPDAPPASTIGAPKISLQRLGSNNSSAKVVALIKHLRQLRREHPRMRSVVFSQFTSFLSLLEPALTRAGVHFLRLDGTMAQKTRAAVLASFKEVNKFTVLLISLRAGGVGLNLTCAQRVYMMDPWWSFAVEAQAIDRVHRMGQEEEVKVYRFIVKESVEERMLKVQERKKFIASSLGMMTDEEKRGQRIEDIRELLG